MKSKHTPGKFIADGERIKIAIPANGGAKIYLTVADCYSPETMHSIRKYNEHSPNEEAEANAEHIVKCVNSHDELVKALTGILELPNTIGHSFQMQDIARNAIRKALGEEAFKEIINSIIDKINK